MKMRTQIINFGMAGMALATLVAGVGFMTNRLLGSAIDATVITSVALQASQQADMMHDAVRGDTLLALVGSMRDNPGLIDEAEKDLAEHAGLFNDALVQMAALPIDAASREALEKTRPVVTKYIETAKQTLAATRTSPDVALAESDKFQTAFEVLGKEMAALSDSVRPKRSPAQPRSQRTGRHLAVGDPGGTRARDHGHGGTGALVRTAPDATRSPRPSKAAHRLADGDPHQPRDPHGQRRGRATAAGHPADPDQPGPHRVECPDQRRSGGPAPACRSPRATTT